MHWYRDHAKSNFDFILGHELVGRVVAKGKGVHKFNVGDIVAPPFSLSCGKSFELEMSLHQEVTLTSNLGECFYCQLGNTARCAKVRAFGSPIADGGQAEYINLSMADSCLFKAPEGMPIDLMVLMTDILPTGYSVARNALTLLEGDGVKSKEKTVCVVIGCGPVSWLPLKSLCFSLTEIYRLDSARFRRRALFSTWYMRQI